MRHCNRELRRIKFYNINFKLENFLQKKNILIISCQMKFHVMKLPCLSVLKYYPISSRIKVYTVHRNKEKLALFNKIEEINYSEIALINLLNGQITKYYVDICIEKN